MAEKEYLATRMFTDRPRAAKEYDALVARGSSAREINVMMTEEGRKRTSARARQRNSGTRPSRGLGSGAAWARSRVARSSRA